MDCHGIDIEELRRTEARTLAALPSEGLPLTDTFR